MFNQNHLERIFSNNTIQTPYWYLTLSSFPLVKILIISVKSCKMLCLLSRVKDFLEIWKQLPWGQPRWFKFHRASFPNFQRSFFNLLTLPWRRPFANQWTGFYMIAASVMKGLNANLTKSSNAPTQFIGNSLEYRRLEELTRLKNSQCCFFLN